jgi:hypothetical protein
MSGRDERFPALSTVPGFADGYHNIHPNCRHVITPYIEELQDDVEGDIQRSNSPLKDTRTRQQIERYDQGQDELRQLRADRKQWEKYRMYLPDDAPKTLAGFRRMKASNSEKYQGLQGMLREVKTIDS